MQVQTVSPPSQTSSAQSAAQLRQVSPGSHVPSESHIFGAQVCTVIPLGAPGRNMPTVTSSNAGSTSASKRKLYSVPQRIALAFGFCVASSVSHSTLWSAAPLCGQSVPENGSPLW